MSILFGLLQVIFNVLLTLSIAFFLWVSFDAFTEWYKSSYTDGKGVQNYSFAWLEAAINNYKKFFKVQYIVISIIILIIYLIITYFNWGMF